MTYNFQYETKAGDFRLKQINNKNSSNSTISKFDYATDAVGRILEWTQQTDSNTPLRYDIGYNRVDELTSAILKNTSNSTIVKNYKYAYDEASNRTGEQIDSVLRGATVNSLNQLTNTAASGPTQIKGKLDKAGTVTINGASAQMSIGGTNFSKDLSLSAGTNNLVVVATGNTTNSRTNTYQIVVPSGASRTLTYDANGNMTSDGDNNSYTWDAADQLVKITYADGSNSNFTYDALGRRVRIVEKNSSNVTTSTKNFLWDGSSIAEQRDGSNNVIRRYYGSGYRDVVNSANYFYARDHLGNVREVVAGNGTTISARYDYDPYGRLTKISGSQDSDFLYTGHYYHAPSGLYLALYRGYDPNLGRFISRDPIAEAGGLNLYGYCGNNPICGIDPLGLQVQVENPGGPGIFLPGRPPQVRPPSGFNIPGPDGPWYSGPNQIFGGLGFGGGGISFSLGGGRGGSKGRGDGKNREKGSVEGIAVGPPPMPKSIPIRTILETTGLVPTPSCSIDDIISAAAPSPLPVGHPDIPGMVTPTPMGDLTTMQYVDEALLLLPFMRLATSPLGATKLGWKGGEITFTKPGASTPDFRINPFGGSGYPPHYHRRPGIGKHRPWQGGW